MMLRRQMGLIFQRENDHRIALKFDKTGSYGTMFGDTSRFQFPCNIRQGERERSVSEHRREIPGHLLFSLAVIPCFLVLFKSYFQGAAYVVVFINKKP